MDLCRMLEVLREQLDPFGSEACRSQSGRARNEGLLSVCSFYPGPHKT